MIYVIQAGENGPVKIGSTNNGIEERIKQLQVGCPYELKLLWKFYGDDPSESRIHDDLKSEHVRGEWFHPSEKVFGYMADNLQNWTNFDLQLYGGNCDVWITENSNKSVDIELPDYNMEINFNGQLIINPTLTDEYYHYVYGKGFVQL